ncbi:hypothetical protein WDU94_002249 [Cyamophila willieti]
MYSKIKIEVCVDNVASAIAAVQGGADRLELCSALSEGGLTPTLGLYRAVKSVISALVPVFVMIRPRAGFDFNFSPTEIDLMKNDCAYFAQEGADGFVIGALTAEQEIDLDCVRRLIAVIGDRPITFHRAFDVVRDPERALDQLIGLGGITRVLTSGQKNKVLDGLPLLHRLQKLAGNRIILMPGSGIGPHNVLSILKPPSQQTPEKNSSQPSEILTSKIVGLDRDGKSIHSDISANNSGDRKSHHSDISDSKTNPPGKVPMFQEIHLSGKRTVKHVFTYENEVCANSNIDVTDERVIRQVREIVDELVRDK